MSSRRFSEDAEERGYDPHDETLTQKSGSGPADVSTPLGAALHSAISQARVLQGEPALNPIASRSAEFAAGHADTRRDQ